MGVPWEAVFPLAIYAVGIAGAGVVIGFTGRLQQNGQALRYSQDQWDRNMLERDRRLMGYPWGQQDKVLAHPDFALNSAWRLERRIMNR